ncbi:hypothetical protein O181_024180 [Austropuccinia psidii MF-1]|uniref:Uncharacterized protein n=1 Tax=Austropuccinia psidii MF-1 TaxID=1389203 RepID=A0A9Q3GZU9_9BASI|nr:hypothetical protein [Austropuccinia psidii MF-1]
MHPFDAPFWRGPPSYCTDAGVIQVNVRVHNQMTNDLGQMQMVASLQCQGWGKKSLAPTCFHTQGTFTLLAHPLHACLPTRYLLVWVSRLTADAHPLAHGNLRPISMDLLKHHMH